MPVRDVGAAAAPGSLLLVSNVPVRSGADGLRSADDSQCCWPRCNRLWPTLEAVTTGLIEQHVAFVLLLLQQHSGRQLLCTDVPPASGVPHFFAPPLSTARCRMPWNIRGSRAPSVRSD